MRKYLAEDKEDAEPDAWRKARSLDDDVVTSLPKDAVPNAYRQRRLVQATAAQDAERQPLYRVPQRPYLDAFRKKNPGAFGVDRDGRVYLWAAEKLPFGEGPDEAALFFRRKDYSSAQRTLYVVLPYPTPVPGHLAEPLDFPERDTLAIQWPGEQRARSYKILHGDFENKRAVGVAVVVESGLF